MPNITDNRNWDIRPDRNGMYSWDQVQTALLQDIRHELQRIRAVAECPNAIAIPRILRRILRRITKNTTKRKRK